MCSTSCFSRFGSSTLDAFLTCSVEKEGCVNVPRDLGPATWTSPKEDQAPGPVDDFDVASMEGTWYKVLGMNSRYDCFDCQKNTFTPAEEPNKPWRVAVEFSLPRPRGGAWNNRVSEDMFPEATPDMRKQRSYRTKGEMFGLTFWENWYIIGQRDEGPDPYKFVYYTGHTLQGNYRGAFVYVRTPTLPQSIVPELTQVAERAKLKLADFCVIDNDKVGRRQDGERERERERGGMRLARTTGKAAKEDIDRDANLRWFTSRSIPLWNYRFFELTRLLAEEFSDWFEDPSITSQWLVEQQRRVILTQPFAVSPFAENPLGTDASVNIDPTEYLLSSGNVRNEQLREKVETLEEIFDAKATVDPMDTSSVEGLLSLNGEAMPVEVLNTRGRSSSPFTTTPASRRMSLMLARRGADGSAVRPPSQLDIPPLPDELEMEVLLPPAQFLTAEQRAFIRQYSRRPCLYRPTTQQQQQQQPSTAAASASRVLPGWLGRITNVNNRVPTGGPGMAEAAMP